MSEKVEAIFGGGCFWCLEAVFQRIPGVVEVISGYIGGEAETPTYQEVCSGQTGHAEVIKIVFEPEKITFKKLLEVFWACHDPTQLNRQGGDVGTQYRSAIFYLNEEQKTEAEASKEAQDASGSFSDPIVTEISPASTFYPAEDYHQNYYNENSNAGFCMFNITPKLQKLGLL